MYYLKEGSQSQEVWKILEQTVPPKDGAYISLSSYGMVAMVWWNSTQQVFYTESSQPIRPLVWAHVPDLPDFIIVINKKCGACKYYERPPEAKQITYSKDEVLGQCLKHNNPTSILGVCVDLEEKE